MFFKDFPFFVSQPYINHWRLQHVIIWLKSQQEEKLKESNCILRKWRLSLLIENGHDIDLA